MTRITAAIIYRDRQIQDTAAGERECWGMRVRQTYSCLLQRPELANRKKVRFHLPIISLKWHSIALDLIETQFSSFPIDDRIKEWTKISISPTCMPTNIILLKIQINRQSSEVFSEKNIRIFYTQQVKCFSCLLPDLHIPSHEMLLLYSSLPHIPNKSFAFY